MLATKTQHPQQIALIVGAILGLFMLVTGVLLNVLGDPHARWQLITGLLLSSLGSALLFPIAVSVIYDKLREKWLGDEVWRLFSELSEAGIDRIYKDREKSDRQDDAVKRLTAQFRQTKNGQVRMIGPTLRVFFNDLGDFTSDIQKMLVDSDGTLQLRTLVANPHSASMRDRIAAEEGAINGANTSKSELDVQLSLANMIAMSKVYGNKIQIRQFVPAPYATVVIFPSVAYYSPNILSNTVPARLPMILFRAGSHAYDQLAYSFEYLWDHGETTRVE